MTTLREKQQAVDPPDIGHGAQPASRDLMIMFAEGGSDLIMHAGGKGTVKGVRWKVCGVPGTLSERLARCSGQIKDG